MKQQSGLDALRAKIVKKGDLEALSRKYHGEGMRIVTTNGVFDLLHVGHIESLFSARSHGDVLIVGINSDASVKKYKGESRPIIKEDDRALMVAALSCVDCVFIYDDETPIPWIPLIRPYIHTKGSDRTLDQIVEREVVERYGGTVVLLPHTGIHSTTSIIARVNSSI